MIFDLNDKPVDDNEYLQRILAITILLVKAAGGELVITKDMQDELAAQRGKHFLDQEQFDDGRLVLTVGERP